MRKIKKIHKRHKLSPQIVTHLKLYITLSSALAMDGINGALNFTVIHLILKQKCLYSYITLMPSQHKILQVKWVWIQPVQKGTKKVPLYSKIWWSIWHILSLVLLLPKERGRMLHQDFCTTLQWPQNSLKECGQHSTEHHHFLMKNFNTHRKVVLIKLEMQCSYFFTKHMNLQENTCCKTEILLQIKLV